MIKVRHSRHGEGFAMTDFIEQTLVTVKFFDTIRTVHGRLLIKINNFKACDNCGKNKDILGRLCEDCLEAHIKKYKYRQKNYFKKYNISELIYTNSLKEQDNRCAICKTEQKLHIDHNHKTGKFRGLLCFRCNTGLGFFKENIENMLMAIDYINKHNYQNLYYFKKNSVITANAESREYRAA